MPRRTPTARPNAAHARRTAAHTADADTPPLARPRRAAGPIEHATTSAPTDTAVARPGERRVVARIAPVRAVVALLWAAALVVAVGGASYATAADLPAGIAALVAAYPLVNAVASLVEAAAGAGRSAAVLLADAALSIAAAAGLAAAGLAGDAGATLAVFGAWAFVSGAIQLRVALSRRTTTRQWPMIVSGTLSTFAGIAFAFSATGDTADLTSLAGYAALGAVLYLVWAARTRSTGRPA